MATSDKQIGGEHYKKPVQHWDWAQYLPYLEGCATKYFGRHASKNGLEDIAKGLSFIAKICASTYGHRLDWIITKIPDEEGPEFGKVPRPESMDVQECDYNVSD